MGGAGKGKGQAGAGCYVCGRPGHQARNCTARAAHSLDEGSWDDGSWQAGWQEQGWQNADYAAGAGAQTYTGGAAPGLPSPGGFAEPQSDLGGLFLTTFERVEDQVEEIADRMAILGTLGSRSRKVTFGVDSGASTTVMKDEDCDDYPVDPRYAATYLSACKQTLRTRGRRSLVCENGNVLRAEVGPVSKNLLAVAELCDTGHTVTFDAETGYRAVHKHTGKRLDFQRVGKVFNVAFDVQPYGPFGRQGR